MILSTCLFFFFFLFFQNLFSPFLSLICDIFPLSPSHFPSLSFSLSPSFPLTLLLFLSLSPFLSLSHSLTFSLSLPHSLSLSIYLSICLSLSLLLDNRMMTLSYHIIFFFALMILFYQVLCANCEIEDLNIMNNALGGEPALKDEALFLLGGTYVVPVCYHI